MSILGKVHKHQAADDERFKWQDGPVPPSSVVARQRLMDKATTGDAKLLANFKADALADDGITFGEVDESVALPKFEGPHEVHLKPKSQTLLEKTKVRLHPEWRNEELLKPAFVDPFSKGQAEIGVDVPPVVFDCSRVTPEMIGRLDGEGLDPLTLQKLMEGLDAYPAGIDVNIRGKEAAIWTRHNSRIPLTAATAVLIHLWRQTPPDGNNEAFARAFAAAPEALLPIMDQKMAECLATQHMGTIIGEMLAAEQQQLLEEIRAHPQSEMTKPALRKLAGGLNADQTKALADLVACYVGSETDTDRVNQKVAHIFSSMSARRGLRDHRFLGSALAAVIGGIKKVCSMTLAESMARRKNANIFVTCVWGAAWAFEKTLKLIGGEVGEFVAKIVTSLLVIGNVWLGNSKMPVQLDPEYADKLLGRLCREFTTELGWSFEQVAEARWIIDDTLAMVGLRLGGRNEGHDMSFSEKAHTALMFGSQGG